MGELGCNVIWIVWSILSIQGSCRRFCIEQKHIRRNAETNSRILGFATAGLPLPNDIVSKIPSPEHGVHKLFQVVAGRRVAVQVDATGFLENPSHRQQSHGHEAQESAHVVAVAGPRSLYDVHYIRVIVLDLVNPFLMYVLLPRPSVLKFRALCQTIRCRVEIAALVERRVGGDQVHRFGVHGPEEAEIVSVEERPVLPVGFAHCHTSFSVSVLYISRLPISSATETVGNWQVQYTIPESKSR